MIFPFYILFIFKSLIFRGFSPVKKIEPTIQEVIYEWSPGDELPDITKSSTKRIGMFLVTSDSEVELKKSITKVLNYFSELK